MIRSAYIAPTESAPRLIDVKRALLTYDEIYLPDPGDRELIPRQSYMMALGFPPIMGFDMGPVRPMGKTSQYDNDFDRLMDDLYVARNDECVKVVSTYDLSSSDGISVGAVMMGDYPLHPNFMFNAYRNVASDKENLETAIRGDAWLMSLTDEEVNSLAAPSALADNRLNDGPELPQLESPLSRENLRSSLTAIARARLGSAIKSVGYCASKDIVPIFTSSSFEALVATYASRATEVIDYVGEEDPYWLNRRRALKVAHEEYLDDNVLAEMPVSEILSLRSKAWG